MQSAMLTFFGKRLLQLVPTLFFVSLIIFSLQRLLPGDPALVMAGEEKDPDVIEQIRRQYHLDQPLPVQYVYWLNGLMRGDLGESLRIKQPVLALVLEKLPVTTQLAIMAMVIALLIGISAGIISAVKKDSAWDYGANALALWGISTPNFWLGIMLIFLFSVHLGWLPASGYVRLSEGWGASLASTIMPAFVLGNAIAAVLMRHTRSAMLSVLDSDYVRTARAKGLADGRVVWRHALRNALIPVVTVVGLTLPSLVGGAVLTETVFAWPGIGRLAVGAVFERDYPVIMGVNLIVAGVVIAGNLVTDLAYCVIDPRISYQ
jgi:peptide/nickel transport system permease protein